MLVLQAYDDERELYIKDLEAENERLREELREATDSAVANATNSQNNLLRAICAGAFDNLKKAKSG